MEVRIFSKTPILAQGEPARQDPQGVSGFLIASGDIGIANPPETINLEVLHGWRVQGTTRGRTLVVDVRSFKRVRLTATVAVYSDDPAGLQVVQDP